MTVVTLRAGAPRSARLFLAQIAVAPRRGGIGALLFDRELGYRARVESDRVARLGQQHRP